MNTRLILPPHESHDPEGWGDDLTLYTDLDAIPRVGDELNIHKDAFKGVVSVERIEWHIDDTHGSPYVLVYCRFPDAT